MGPVVTTPTQVVVEQLKRLRRHRNVNTAALAAHCADLGAAEVTDQVVRNIETGRRTVSVDHLTTLALALDVSPVHLLTRHDDSDRRGVQATTTLHVEDDAWTAWIRGTDPLPVGMSGPAFWGYLIQHAPPEEGQAMISLARAQAGAAAARVMAQVQADSEAEIRALQAATQRALDTIEKAAGTGDVTAVLQAVTDARAALTTPPEPDSAT
jgi:transcriptional regulator with XRE-family HTH domain